MICRGIQEVQDPESGPEGSPRAVPRAGYSVSASQCPCVGIELCHSQNKIKGNNTAALWALPYQWAMCAAHDESGSCKLLHPQNGWQNAGIQRRTRLHSSCLGLGIETT